MRLKNVSAASALFFRFCNFGESGFSFTSQVNSILISFGFCWRTRQTLWGGRTDANPKLSLNDT